ncbi:hypothetical protein RvY_18306 [Ramazzottius varieornatus]|uniref:Ammonium transporter AmtB-like domain-containing protein n=1 Tax=Ramazzottius varieornatus TaxID=947166 RepID=A0A1D1WA96_RAMVA|nr:hypothetical protein RvY_18306 [Ramazzottius varieornatus]
MDEEEQPKKGMFGKFGLLIFLSELGFIIIFGCLVDYGWDATAPSLRTQFLEEPLPDRATAGAEAAPPSNLTRSLRASFQVAPELTKDRVPEERYYSMFQDIHVMVFVGFGFLMTFLRKYGYGAIGFNFLLAAYVLQWASIMRGFFRLSENHYRIRLDLVSLISADFTAATILITLGVVLGKLSTVQYIMMVLIETVLVTLNEWIIIDLFHIKDVGGSIAIHLFGAYFGLALAKTIHDRAWTDEEFNRLKYGTHYNDLFSLVGAVFLWMFWPSFNAALALEDGKYRAIYNTYFAMSASCLGAFMISSLANRSEKFSLEIVQNATLAGGVIVGSICDLYLYPWGAIICGFCAGIISALGFRFVSPILERKVGIHDTCGVHNLHAMPSFAGSLISAIVVGCASKQVYGSEYYTHFPKHAPPADTVEYAELKRILPDLEPGLGWTPAIQAGYQMAAMGVTLGIALVGGILTGLILRLPIWDRQESHEVFDDARHWELPQKMNKEQERKLRTRLGSIDILSTGLEAGARTPFGMQIPMNIRTVRETNGSVRDENASMNGGHDGPYANPRYSRKASERSDNLDDEDHDD